MPLILNIETSTEICSVCLSKGEKIIASRETTENFVHAEIITLQIAACLSEAKVNIHDVDAVAVSAGPGSYTGLRVGTSTAKGICFALNKPLLAIDTLASLAQASREESSGTVNLYCPMIDARRMEVYTSLYDERLKLLAPAHALILRKDSFDKHFNKGRKIIFSGNANQKIQDLYPATYAKFSSIRCSARHLVPLSIRAFREKKFVDIAYFSPNYLKSPNITVSKKKGIGS